MAIELEDLVFNLGLLVEEVPVEIHSMYHSIIGEIIGVKLSTTQAKDEMNLIANKYNKGEINTFHHELIYADDNHKEISKVLHVVMRDVSNVFCSSWGREFIFGDIFSEIKVKRENNGCLYIKLMSNLICGIIADNNRLDYRELIILGLCESIEGRDESAYSICLALARIIVNEILHEVTISSYILIKTKEANSSRMSEISSKPKSNEYERVIKILSKTISACGNASVNSLIEKIREYYDDNKMIGKPAVNTLRRWIGSYGYKPQKPTTNNYELVL
ncbi:TPA: hypothetical protein PXN54_002136 [Yersinia enterocolitica]|nr:hypothetical protein [Yersinia enterocolitica]